MREMREKFGAEVKTFPYAFVLKSRYPGWDSQPQDPTDAQGNPMIPALPPHKLPTYIEIKPRLP